MSDLLNGDDNYTANSSHGIDGHTKLVVIETSSEAKRTSHCNGRMAFSSWPEQQSGVCVKKWNRRLFVLRDHVEMDVDPCSINKYIHALVSFSSQTLHFCFPIAPPITLSLLTLSLVKTMASNDNNSKCKLEEAETSAARKRLWLSDNVGDDVDSSDSEHEDTKEEEDEEMEEEVSSEESLMNQVDTSEDKLVAKHGSGLFFGDNDNTTSPSSDPRTLETLSSRMRLDLDGSDDDGSNDDDFWM
jgi:hypothetical protein